MTAGPGPGAGAVVVLLLGMMLLGVVQFLGWKHRRQPIGDRVLAAVDVETRVQHLPFDPAETRYTAVLSYWSGRKGPEATLRIYDSSTSPSLEQHSLQAPVEIRVEAGLELYHGYDAGFGGTLGAEGRKRDAWGAGVRTISVTEDEIGVAASYLEPINADGDYDVEFFVHQDAVGTARGVPVNPGTYVVDFDGAANVWEVRRWRGWRPFWMVGAHVRHVRWVVIVATLAAALSCLGSGARARDVLAAIIGTAAGGALCMVIGAHVLLDVSAFVISIGLATAIAGRARSCLKLRRPRA